MDDAGPPVDAIAWPVVLTEHVFDKVRSIDMTLAEFSSLLSAPGVVIEEIVSIDGVKELVL